MVGKDEGHPRGTDGPNVLIMGCGSDVPMWTTLVGFLGGKVVFVDGTELPLTPTPYTHAHTHAGTHTGTHFHPIICVLVFCRHLILHGRMSPWSRRAIDNPHSAPHAPPPLVSRLALIADSGEWAEPCRSLGADPLHVVQYGQTMLWHTEQLANTADTGADAAQGAAHDDLFAQTQMKTVKWPPGVASAEQYVCYVAFGLY